MANDNIHIKKKDSGFLLLGFLSLLGILAGIFLATLSFFPFAPDNQALVTVLLIVGILIAVISAVFYALIFYRGIKQQDALIITNKGFTNLLIGGKDGIYVEWVSVKSIKIFGMSRNPMLGLTLTDNQSYLSMLSGKDLRNAEDNLELGLPVIAIPQNSVYTPVADLKTLFSRMIKGALSWENYTTQGKKEPAVSEPKAEPEQSRTQAFLQQETFDDVFLALEDEPEVKEEKNVSLFNGTKTEEVKTELSTSNTVLASSDEEVPVLDLDDDKE